jgi:hypothetical protein
MCCRLPLLLIIIITNSVLVNAQNVNASPVKFKKHILLNKFISEGVAVGDVNNDGKTDILAGTSWFESPTWKQHTLHSDTMNPIPGYSTTFLNFCMDVNSDGWNDLIRFDQPGAVCAWYENPKNRKGLWQSHNIISSAGMETPAFADVDGDGRKDLICNDTRLKQVIWLKSPTAKNDTVWQRYIVSNDTALATHRYTHGLGWGDINKDGRNDVIIKTGWWESPGSVKASDWKFHSADLGEDCANMFVYDVDKDGDQDVISSSAHDYGIWWYEQKQDGGGNISWVTHEISKLFSESHCLAFEDINRDGHPDLITGKRYFAHNGGDPGGMEPAVLYWFEYAPGKNPSWTPHKIDDDSGVGNSMVVKDINGDRRTDIIISNKKGVFFFEQLK